MPYGQGNEILMLEKEAVSTHGRRKVRAYTTTREAQRIAEVKDSG
jgi:hypothetical protein